MWYDLIIKTIGVKQMKQKIKFAKQHIDEFKNFVLDFCKENCVPFPEHKEARKAFIDKFWEDKH